MPLRSARKHSMGKSNLATTISTDRQNRTAKWSRGRSWRPAEPPVIIDTERKWIKPVRDSTAPLRTMLMDKNNPLPPHKTRQGLLKSYAALNRAHSSYDLDGDGIVSVADYKIAREMDTDNSGIIDEEEHDIGREYLARKFYEEANEYTQRNKLNHIEIKKKAHKLATLEEKQFGRQYQKLKRALWIKESRGGMKVIQCLNFKGTKSNERFTEQKFADSSIKSARTQKIRKCATIAELRQTRKQQFIDTEEKKRLEVAHLDRYRFPTGRRFGKQGFLENLIRYNGLHVLKYANHNTDRIISARLKQKGLIT